MGPMEKPNGGQLVGPLEVLDSHKKKANPKMKTPSKNKITQK